MVFIRRLTFKTGIGPSPLTRLRKTNIFIGQEKLDLAKTRIFGQMISGNDKSGLRKLKQNMSGFQKAQYNEPMRIHSVIPVYFDPEERLKKIEKYEAKKAKIMMKGLKQKSGGGVSAGSMGMFEKKA